MREITCSGGEKTQVSDEDYEFLSQWNWYAAKGSNGKMYAVRNRRKDEYGPVQISMSRTVAQRAGQSIVGKDVDHDDRNTLNNQRHNLVATSRSLNCHNSRVDVRSKTGVTGVYFYTKYNKWVAKIQVNGRRIHLGYFDDYDAAVAARLEAEVKYLGRTFQ